MNFRAPLANLPPEVKDELQPALQRPCVWLAVALLSGILWADVSHAPPLPVTLLCVAAIILTAYCVWRAPFWGPKLFLLAVFLLGGALHSWRTTPAQAILSLPATLEIRRLPARVVQIRQRESWGQQAVVDLRPSLPSLAIFQLPAAPRVYCGDVLGLENIKLDTPCLPGQLVTAPYWARRGVFMAGEAEQITTVYRAQPWRSGMEEAIARVREHFLQILTQSIGGPAPDTYAALLAGMIYGMHTVPLPDVFIDLFRRSGTIHLLVVSGAQVSLIAGALIFLVRGRQRKFPLWGIFLVLLGLLFFALIAGPEASILRASAMAIILLGSLVSGRSYDFPSALALSAGLFCLLDTSALFHPGMQLTYACALGVYVAWPPRPLSHSKGLRYVLMAAARGTGGAWLFSTPLLLAHFHHVPLLGLLANVLAVPLAGLILYLGLLALLVGLIWPPLAVPFCVLARGLLEIMLWNNKLFASLPLAIIEPVYFSWPYLLLWYIAAGAALLLWRAPRLRAYLTHKLPARQSWAGAIAGAGVLFLLLAFAQAWPPSLRVHVLDVGAGQTVLVQTPAANIVIDAGADPRPGFAEKAWRQIVLPFLVLHKVRRLDALIISHPHEDHNNLAIQILQHVPTRWLLWGAGETAASQYEPILRTACSRHTRVGMFPPRSSIRLGTNVWLHALAAPPAKSFSQEDCNNASLVLQLVYKQIVFLFPADISEERQKQLQRDYSQPGQLHADVLIAPHHGSSKANQEFFIRRIAPRIVIFSCSRWAAPRADVLQAYEKAGAQIWRTDKHGTITIQSKGHSLHVQSQKFRMY